MKYLHILVIFILATALMVVGALFKLMHWPGASLMLIIGMGGQFISLVLLAAKVISERKNNDFLNK
ncbi:GldL-related protein [Flavobacterium suzhouense]|uniref:Gliding motility protein GldL-like N-terminal domain-containing protein n=1 Tax=Flavobacterium suzhouense TaxID=1529638 RepID=A0ABW5P064_9FLAO